MSTPTAGAHTQEPWPISHIPAIAERLKTQNNQGTEEPMFCVQEKVKVLGINPDFSDETMWVDTEDGYDEITAEEAENTPGAQQFGYVEYWKTVMVAFTEAGVQDYVRQNGHNHRGDLRIYVESFRRCEEMIAIRAHLMAAPGKEIPAMAEELASLRLQNETMRGALDVARRAVFSNACGGYFLMTQEDMAIVRSAVKFCESGATGDAAVERLRHCRHLLSQILADLPTNKDWLDPALEREAREAIKLSEEAAV